MEEKKENHQDNILYRMQIQKKKKMSAKYIQFNSNMMKSQSTEYI